VLPRRWLDDYDTFSDAADLEANAGTTKDPRFQKSILIARTPEKFKRRRCRRFGMNFLPVWLDRNRKAGIWPP
jgi:hypothetical protein